MRCLLVLVSLLLTGCVSYQSTIPKGYNGPLAIVDDSFTVHSSRTADMFVIEKADNKNVINAIVLSRGASTNKGGVLLTQGYSHKLPVLKNKLVLLGHTTHGAPIGYMLNAGSNYEVSGEVEFTPEEGQHYLVSGELSKESSSVWIENINGEIVTDVIYLEKGKKQSVKMASTAFLAMTSIKRNPKKTFKNEEAKRVAVFSQIRGGESLKRVLAKLGEPDSTRYDDGNIFTRRPSHIDYIYNGLGKVRFTSFQEQARSVLRIFVETSEQSGPDLVQLETTGITLRNVAKAYYTQSSLSQAELDKIADTIWQNRFKEDNYTEDAVAWLMKVIGKQRANRYYNLIYALTEKKTYSRKIRRYADKVLSQLNQVDIQQYQFASDSLKNKNL